MSPLTLYQRVGLRLGNNGSHTSRGFLLQKNFLSCRPPASRPAAWVRPPLRLIPQATGLGNMFCPRTMTLSWHPQVSGPQPVRGTFAPLSPSHRPSLSGENVVVTSQANLGRGPAST